MKKVLFIFMLLSSLLLAKEYEYSFHKNGVPTVRVEKSTGIVEIYSNLYSFSLKADSLRKLHKDMYSAISYDIFIKRLQSNHKNINKAQIEDTFRWIEYNEYLKIKDLLPLNPAKLLRK